MYFKFLLVLLMTNFVVFCSSSKKQDNAGANQPETQEFVEESEAIAGSEELNYEDYAEDYAEVSEGVIEDVTEEDLENVTEEDPVLEDPENITEKDPVLEDPTIDPIDQVIETYTLTVKVEGLSELATGLITSLRLGDGTNDFTVEEDGEYTFAREYLVEEGYSISIIQPTKDVGERGIECAFESDPNGGVFPSGDILLNVVCIEIPPLFFVEDSVGTGLFEIDGNVSEDIVISGSLVPDVDEAAGRFCLLSSVYFSNIDGENETTSCNANFDSTSSPEWTIDGFADASGSDQQAECSATCIAWSDDDFAVNASEMVEISVGSGSSESDVLDLNSSLTNTICGIGKIEFSDLGGDSEFAKCSIAEGFNTILDSWFLVLDKNNNAKSTCGARCLEFPIDSGAVLSENIYEADLNGGEGEAAITNLKDATDSYCYLSSIMISGTDKAEENAKCEVYINGDEWELKADLGANTTNNISVECEARCLEW